MPNESSIVIPRGLRPTTPRAQIHPDPRKNESTLRCDCGCMEFGVVVQVSQERSAARIALIACLQCSGRVDVADGVLNRNGKLSNPEIGDVAT
jgi:hypothetical protein